MKSIKEGEVSRMNAIIAVYNSRNKVLTNEEKIILRQFEKCLKILKKDSFLTQLFNHLFKNQLS